MDARGHRAAPGSTTDLDWFKTWRDSPEFDAVHGELQRLKDEPVGTPQKGADPGSYREFAAGFWTQFGQVLYRLFQQYWRTPSYIYSKTSLCVLVALFIGFVFFQVGNSMQSLQNQMFAIFNILTIFGQLVQQTMPVFVVSRSLYEVRERPSKVYGWRVFMLSQIVVEICYNSLCSVLMFFCWYYPVGLYRNAEAAGQVTERGALMFLLLLGFLLFTSTFTDFIIAGFSDAEAGANVANLLFTLCLIFCGVLANPNTLASFWIFMYRVSPFTYMVSAMLSTGVANTNVVCAANELVQFQPLNGTSCGQYMDVWLPRQPRRHRRLQLLPDQRYQHLPRRRRRQLRRPLAQLRPDLGLHHLQRLSSPKSPSHPLLFSRTVLTAFSPSRSALPSASTGSPACRKARRSRRRRRSSHHHPAAPSSLSFYSIYAPIYTPIYTPSILAFHLPALSRFLFSSLFCILNRLFG